MLANNDNAVCLACRVPLWERCLPAKNDDAVCLADRSAWFAGKPRSNGKLSRLLEPSLPAKNDDAVCLADRSAWFAGKPRSNGKLSRLWEPILLAMNDNAVCLADRSAWFAGKPRSNRGPRSPVEQGLVALLQPAPELLGEIAQWCFGPEQANLRLDIFQFRPCLLQTTGTDFSFGE